MSDVEVAGIMIDTTDPDRLVEFWTSLLGLEVRHRHPTFVFLTPVTEGGPSLAFQTVPERKAGKNRIHLDLHSADREAAVARVIELGGSRLDDHHVGDFHWTVCADPEGNEFCIADG